jgi:ubiquinone biosynthesis protein
VVTDYQKTVLNELDLMREAANCAQIGRNWQGSDIIKVPKIYWDFCRQNILVQERIFGIPINDIEALEAAGIDIKQLALNGVEIFFTQVFHHNLFHADMHPGNVFVDITDPKKPLYAAVDFGIVGSLSEKDLRYLARSFSSFINKDYKKIAQLFIQSGWVPKDTREDEFEASIRTVCDPIADKPLKDISFGQLLLRLFQTARDFKMENQPQLVQLEKTLLNIEGLGRQLYPELDFISAAGPVLKDWESKQTNFKTLLKKIQNDGPEIRESLEQLPQFARQLMDEGYSNSLPDNTELKTILGSIYKSIIGMGVLISGIIMLNYTVFTAWAFIVVGLMILFFGKPIK